MILYHYTTPARVLLIAASGLKPNASEDNAYMTGGIPVVWLTRQESNVVTAAYVAAYARPGRMRAGWAYFVSFQQAAKDFAQLSHTKLTMPVLAIGGDKANGTVLGNQMKLVATNPTMIVLKDTGHWVLEERPKETTEALMKFL